MYDDTLNINTAYFLKWGAFFYIAIGFWNLTNVQMFDNIVIPLKWQADLDTYEHTIAGTLHDHYLIIFFAAIGLFLILFSLEIWELIRENFTSDKAFEPDE